MEKQNNFDALRTIAAIMVVFSHSIPLSYGTNQMEPLWRLSRHQTTIGHLAVIVFFVISGYLITQSFMRSRSLKIYLIARGLRLLPGLAVVLIFLAFIAGPMMTTKSLGEYFWSYQPYKFFIHNILFINFVDGLPGVFTRNPFHDAVNGSLWTLHYEVECYILILCLGLLGMLNRFTSFIFLFAGLMALKFWIGGDRVEMATYFLAGSALYHWRPPLRGTLAAICATLWAVALMSTGFRIASATVGAYLVIYLAMAPALRLPNLTRWGDLSYGTYIWAFPVQQAIAAAVSPGESWYLNVAISLPIILGLAWISWHFIEAPALRLKKSTTAGRESTAVGLRPGIADPVPSTGAPYRGVTAMDGAPLDT